MGGVRVTIEKPKHWCHTCGQLRALFELATKQIQKLTPEEKQALRRDWRKRWQEHATR